MDTLRADKKTTKSDFDIQMDVAAKQSDGGDGVSFAILNNNKLEYLNIPTTSGQRFVYFENTSKLSREEREKIRIEIEKIKKAVQDLKNE